MNKKFVSMIVCSMLLSGGLATTMVSCSDDNKEDITNLKDATADLNKQLAALQSALTANQDAAKQAADAAARALAEAQEAAKKGDTALQEAKNAAAEAELAKKAAATAKAEAIQEVIAQLKPLIDAASKLSSENASAIAALAGRIDGIEKGLSNIDLSDINAQLGGQATAIAANAQAIQALQTQMAALSNLQQELTAHANAISGLDAKVATIEATLGQLKSLEADVKANKASLEEVKSQVTALAAKITEEIGNSINTLAGVLSQRLTSVTLMPDLYVGGIPTIPFVSAKYTKLVYTGGEWKKATSGKKDFLVTNNTATAQYRLSPGTITESDIVKSGLGYYTKIATARSGEVLDDIVYVADANVGDNGILTVKLGKNTTDELNLAGNKIYTVSLKVPIADKHLFTEQGEKEAAVYSEFTRLEETFFQPELAFIKGEYISDNVSDHMSDSTAVYNSGNNELICKKIAYDIAEPYNLYDLVEACKFVSPNSHTPMTLEQAREYGFNIKFEKAEKAYTLAATSTDKTNQQEFVKLSGENKEFLTPVASNGVTGNKVIIGKQPIIRAMLYDTANSNMIDVKYLKVLFTPEETKPITIDWGLITSTGAPCTGASYDFTWKDMAEKVLMKIGEKGMSKEEFTKVYTKYDIKPENNDNGELKVFTLPENLDASIPVMSWILTPEQLGTLKPGENTVTVKKTVVFTDPTGIYAPVTISLQWTVKTTVGAASLGETDPLKWQNNTMKVYPVPMKLVNGKFDGTTAYYATNILEGRLKPYVKGILSCGNYDIDYAKSGNPSYPGEPLTFTPGFGHWTMTMANQNNLLDVTYTIKNDAAGKQLVSNGGIIKVDWSTNINGLTKNRQVFATTNLQIVKILSINTLLGQQIVDNSVGQTINISNNYTMTDAFGNLVAKQATAQQPLAYDYYQFYAVQDPKFEGQIVISDDVEGKVNVRTLAQLNMTADIDQTTGDLTFQNNGSPLQADAYIIVPVSVEHKWGTLKGHIAVPLKKSSAPLNVRRK